MFSILSNNNRLKTSVFIACSGLEIEYKENTTFYLFTDGFADQFGGPNGKKFKYKPFAEILVQNVNKTPNEQSAILAEKFEAWKGELEQVDDVCVIGVRIQM